MIGSPLVPSGADFTMPGLMSAGRRGREDLNSISSLMLFDIVYESIYHTLPGSIEVACEKTPLMQQG